MKIDWWMIIKNSFPVLLKLWPLWVLILVVAVISLIPDLMSSAIRKAIGDWRIRLNFKRGEAGRSDRDLLRWLRGMKPSEFEEYIADLFSRLGYKTQVVGQSHDGGIDVIVEKNGIKSYIQCKKFITSVVSVGAVRDFYGAIADLAQGKAYFITTNKFTLEAERFCEDKPIELVDGLKLIKYIHLADKNTKQPEVIQSANPVQEKCLQCNGYLIKKQGEYGDFYGCSNYPKCQYTKNI